MSLTPQDLAQAAKLLERLRTGELNVIPGFNPVKVDESTQMLQRVEAYLSEGIRRMTEPIGDGGPAFPVLGPEGDWQAGDGMTLRDYFAAKVPAEALNIDGWSVKQCAAVLGLPQGTDYSYRLHYAQLLALLSYEWADAMLDARSNAERHAMLEARQS